MGYLLYALLGIGLAAACGFRVFVPLLVVSIAAVSGNLELGSGSGWIRTWPALIVFAVATVLEIVAYYVVWLDNLLDTIATPAPAAAGRPPPLLTADWQQRPPQGGRLTDCGR